MTFLITLTMSLKIFKMSNYKEFLLNYIINIVPNSESFISFFIRFPHNLFNTNDDTHNRRSSRNATKHLSDDINGISNVIGWLYFVAWSVSFYPPLWNNYRSKRYVIP